MARRREGCLRSCACGGGLTVDRDRAASSRFVALARPDAWCEDPKHPRYNAFMRLAADRAGDRLWREDDLYNRIIELDHNTRPRIAGRGSAIFIHVARPGLGPTAGCVGMPEAVLRRLLPRLGPETRVIIE
jgi:L,D-peptidoglycan transpeptidase YkuD (ErfK/YbiS/YcfS/YnhG family)